MKRFILAFLMLISFVAVSNAQIQRYRSSAFAIARVYNGNYSWGDWQQCNIIIDMNLNKDLITIYSSQTQYYRVVSDGESYYDNDGGKNIRFLVIDGENDRGCVRLRIQNDGTSQLYVDFNDVAWCYSSLVRIQ